MTFRLNFPNVKYHHKPVEKLTVDGDKLEPVDVLTAGFPWPAILNRGRTSSVFTMIGDCYFCTSSEL